MTTFTPENVFQEEAPEQSGKSRFAGAIGMWLIHLCKAAFIIYSATHGISASWNYAGNEDWQKLAQIAGIVIVEISLAGLYLAFMNHKIRDDKQVVTAGIAYAIGFLLASFGIVADSHINSGDTLPTWLGGYLQWGLPLAPAVMVVGGILIHYMEPDRTRQRRQKQQQEKLEDAKFDAGIAQQQAELEEAKMVKGLQLASRKAVVGELYKVYTGEAIQQAIQRTALDNLPALLRAAGIHLDGALPSGEGANDAAAPTVTMAADGQALPEVRNRTPHLFPENETRSDPNG